ncbi:protein MULTIPOLAR SPINDLE 1 [Macadamia integrifolia]|uniref:protein MULTIPOLAR SPINDLE 1 n=1 Tax=Macadamia integrifolia TaxID=60698 RepID=UPI001C4F389F|nr:protein MULTIPOLAR SPINDLE 1 [Macadamia integrifolia]
MAATIENGQSAFESNPSLKLAVAVALIRSKLLPKPSASSASPSESEAQRWKRKAKERKLELLRLKEELKELEDGRQYDLFPQSASCRCYFYDNLGKLNPKRVHWENESGCRINEVLRRRFLRRVRLKESRKADNSVRKKSTLELNREDEIEHLGASIDFLVELCDAVSPVEDTTFANLSHQAVDFILATLKSLLSNEKYRENIEGIISSLITRLVRRMCPSMQRDGSSNPNSDGQFYVQHLIRKLGNEQYIGQRTMLFVSQRISLLAESMLFIDPFDDAFSNMHSCMFMMIQLIEFLISDYTHAWATSEGFENKLFEEWLKSFIQARQALEPLESRNGLYLLYMDRVTGELVKQVGQVPFLKTLDPDILDNLVH